MILIWIFFTAVKTHYTPLTFDQNKCNIKPNKSGTLQESGVSVSTSTSNIVWVCYVDYMEGCCGALCVSITPLVGKLITHIDNIHTPPQLYTQPSQYTSIIQTPTHNMPGWLPETLDINNINSNMITIIISIHFIYSNYILPSLWKWHVLYSTFAIQLGQCPNSPILQAFNRNQNIFVPCVCTYYAGWKEGLWAVSVLPVRA